jgi:hypothetical protein
MQAAMRPYAIAGAALLGASVIIVKPLAPQPDPEQGLQQISDAAVRLADADVTLADLENIPYNFFASIVNLPYYEFADPISLSSVAGGAIDYTGDTPGVGATPIPETSLGDIGLLDNVMNYDGNWWLVDAVNVLGIDPGDPPKIAAFADLLAGNPELGNAVSAQLIPIVEAEVPLEAGCTAATAGGCPDPLEILMGSTQSNGVEVPGYFSVPLQDFFSSTGYTFPGTPTDTDPLTNPVPSGEPIPPGFPPGTPTDPMPVSGNEFFATLPWSGETVTLDQNGPADAYWAYLTQSPADNPIEFPTVQDVTTDLSNLATASFNDFNPFVDGTNCLPCAPFVPGDTTNPITSLLDGSGLGSLFDSSSTSSTDLSSLLDGSSLSTDLSSLLDGSSLSTDLSSLLDASSLSTELTQLFDPSTATLDLSALLTTALPDLLSSIQF